MHETMMNSTYENVCCAATRVVDRLRRGRSDERGLTTLEWLLIVAAVAGLAALAVVLVQNVVDETAEEISGRSARGTAARVAAEQITREARADLPAGTNTSDITDMPAQAAAHVEAQRDVNADFGPACRRLEITYGDIEGLTATWTDVVEATLSNGNDATTADSYTAGNQGTTSTHDSGVTAITGESRTEARCTISGI